MSRTKILLGGAFTLLSVLLCSSNGSTRDKEDKAELLRLHERILGARSPKDLGDSYQRFFHYVGREGLWELKHDAHIGLSLQAAWESTLANGQENPEKTLERFLGFVEGKTSLRIPLFWEEEIKAILLSRKREASGEPLQRHNTVRKWHLTGLDLMTPDDVFVRDGHEKLEIAKGEQMIKVDPEEFRKIIHGYPKLQHMILNFAEGRAFLVLYPRDDYRFPLASLNATSGNINWKAEVWALSGRTWRTRLGSWSYEVEIVKSKDTVGIFGENGGECYLEVFDTKKGTNLCRFATNY